jgi:hypothetical protein
VPWLKLPEESETEPAEDASNGGKGSRQQTGDVAQMQTQVPQVHRALQMLRIECPPLVLANAASIRQSRWAACTEAGQPFVGAAQADSGISSEFHKGKALCMEA